MLETAKKDITFAGESRYEVNGYQDGSKSVYFTLVKKSLREWVPDESYHFFLNEFGTIYANIEIAKFFYNYMFKKFPTYEQDYYDYNKNELFAEYLRSASDIETDELNSQMGDDKYYKNYKKYCMSDYFEGLEELKECIKMFNGEINAEEYFSCVQEMDK